MKGKISTPIIERRCTQCSKIFALPNIRDSIAKEYILRFFPCSHCGHVAGVVYSEKEYKRVKWTELPRCIGCYTPFSVVKHHAYGRCKTCHQRKRRLLKKRNATSMTE